MVMSFWRDQLNFAWSTFQNVVIDIKKYMSNWKIKSLCYTIQVRTCDSLMHVCVNGQNYCGILIVKETFPFFHLGTYVYSMNC